MAKKVSKKPTKKMVKKAPAKKAGAGGGKSGGVGGGKKKAGRANKPSIRTKRKPKSPAKNSTEKSGASSNARAAAHLNPKQLKFVREYSLSGNATEAAIAAGYVQRTAAQTGSRLLKDERVAEALGKLQEEAQEEFEVTRDKLYGMLEKAYKLGAVCGAPGAMVSAVSTIARISGLDKPKVQEGDINITVNTGVPEQESDEQ